MNNSWGFSFAGRTIDYFGSKAITSDITALFELIKNSRDANAKKITVHFKQPHTSQVEIEICDDGDGMSENDVKEKWMIIGTDSRLKNNRTKNGKPVWGEMGIGRMACQKLGEKTRMISVKNRNRIAIDFDWSLFENSSVTVDKIKFPIEVTGIQNTKSGVTLKIINLKSKWESKDINKLKDELSILISDDIFDDIDVIVKVGNESGEPIGRNYAKLHKQVTTKAPFKLKAKFDGKKLFTSIFTQVGQRGSWEEQEVPNRVPDVEVGPFSMELFYFPRAPGKQKNSLIEKYYDNRIGTNKLEAFLKQNYGLYIYRDGAWMKPYGGENDWLSLEPRARQETSKIGIKQIYGKMNLSKKKNPGIKPASHRETLIDNDEFKTLRQITLTVFQVLRDYMKKWKEEERERSQKEMGTRTTNVKDSVDDLIKKMKTASKSLPKERQDKFKRLLKGLEYLTGEQREDAESRIADIGEMRSYEKNLATLGIATSFMARHVTKPLETNMELVAEGESMRERVMMNDWKVSKKDQEKADVILENMKENQSKMLHFMKFVNVLADHIAQSIRRNKRHTQVNVLECWKTVSEGFQDKEKELSLELTHSWTNVHDRNAKEQLVVKIDKIDLECILTNMYLNSIESLQKTKGKRSVRFHYWYHEGTLNIEFSDNGIGIPKNKLVEVFEPFKFGHAQTDEQMHGHGLGLHIVKKIMENYDGTAEAADVKEGAKIHLKFPNIKKVAI